MIFGPVSIATHGESLPAGTYSVPLRMVMQKHSPCSLPVSSLNDILNYFRFRSSQIIYYKTMVPIRSYTYVPHAFDNGPSQTHNCSTSKPQKIIHRLEKPVKYHHRRVFHYPNDFYSIQELNQG